MIIKQIYCIYDLKAGYYTTELMLHDNDDVAKRWFDTFLHSAFDTNPNSPIVMYPSDFELHCLGFFDVYESITTVYDSPRPVCKASSFILPKEV